MKALEYLEYLQENIYSKLGIEPNPIPETSKEIQDGIMEKLLSNHKGFVPDEYLEEARKVHRSEQDRIMSMKLPTKFENRIDYAIIKNLAEDIEKTVHEIELTGDVMKDIKKLKDLNLNITTPFFGTLPSGNVNALTCFCDDGYLIIFESDIFYFCNMLSKIIVSSLPIKNDNGRISLNLNEDAIIERLENNSIILKHFVELVIGYVIGGSPRTAPHYLADGPYSSFASVMTQAMERFVMGHEYSHILLQHQPMSNGKIGLIDIKDMYYKIFSWPQEYTADYLGLQLMFHSMNRYGNTNIEINYGSVEAFFSGLEIMKRSIAILQRGNDDWYWKNGNKEGPLGTHPPFQNRRGFTRNLMKTKYGEEYVKASVVIEFIINQLWGNFKPILKSMHDKGIRPHPKWYVDNSFVT